MVIAPQFADILRSALKINQIRNSRLVSCADDGSGVTVFEKKSV